MVAQARALNGGLLTSTELHDMTVEVIERVDHLVHSVGDPPLRSSRGWGADVGQGRRTGDRRCAPLGRGGRVRGANARSDHTTSLVSSFERAGLSIIGKGACSQLSTGATTEPPGFEPTRNPWDLSRSAGGSSGGPAAAVAAGMVAVAHGSDATGSLRTPAALLRCGHPQSDLGADRLGAAGGPTSQRRVA